MATRGSKRGFSIRGWVPNLGIGYGTKPSQYRLNGGHGKPPGESMTHTDHLHARRTLEQLEALLAARLEEVRLHGRTSSPLA